MHDVGGCSVKKLEMHDIFQSGQKFSKSVQICPNMENLTLQEEDIENLIPPRRAYRDEIETCSEHLLYITTEIQFIKNKDFLE